MDQLNRSETHENPLLGLLNTETPHAARSEEEIRSRLLAGTMRTQGELPDHDRYDRTIGQDSDGSPYPELVGSEDLPPLPGGDDLYSEANFSADTSGEIHHQNTPEDSLGHFSSSAYDNEPSIEDSISRLTAPLSVDLLTPPLARSLLNADELKRSLTVKSADLSVQVSINVAGRLLSLTVAEDSLRNLHSTQLARSVMEAVNTARDESAYRAIELAKRNL